jgi:hypothetical protein
LAGFELEPATRTVRRLVISSDGDLHTNPIMHPLSSVALVHDDGEIELRPFGDTSAMPTTKEVAILGRATRLLPHGRVSGRFVGVEVDPADRTIVAVFSRQHLWSRRSDLPAKDLDFSTPGEIRAGSPATAV